MNWIELIRKEGVQMNELPRWNRLINELKDSPGKERDRGNIRGQLTDTKKAKKRGEIFGRNGNKQER